MSLINSNKAFICFVRYAIIKVAVIVCIDREFVYIRYIIPHQKVLQREQSNGFNLILFILVFKYLAIGVFMAFIKSVKSIIIVNVMAISIRFIYVLFIEFIIIFIMLFFWFFYLA